jgi:hypothetical protein
MILLWGIETDGPLLAVRDALCRAGLNVVFLDQHAVLETEIELCVDSDVFGAARSDGQIIDLGEVTAVYLRPYDRRESCVLGGTARSGIMRWRSLIFY